MAKPRCSITHDRCPIDYYWQDEIWEPQENCPLGKYKSSSIVYRPDNPHISRSGNGKQITATINDTCRYYGIARAKELKKEFEDNKEAF